MTKELRFVLVENNEILFDLIGELEYDEQNEFDEGELVFQHPFTGDMYTDVKQCLMGWSEQNEADENTRWELAECILNDEDLMQKVWDIEEGENIEYTL